MIMRCWRRSWRLLAIAVWFPVCALIAVFCQLGGRSGIRRVSYCTRLWGKGCAWISGLRIEYEGTAIDAVGGLIVSNHQSYLDILVDASLFPIRFTPKKEIRSWFLLGPFLGLSRPIWIDRSNRQQSKAAELEYVATLHDNIPLLVYPEGTTSEGVGDLLPFKSPPFESVVGTQIPIRPIVTVYQRGTHNWNPAWHGDQTLLPHVWRLLGEPRIRVKVVGMPITYAADGEDRKMLAERVRTQMQAQWQLLKNPK